ncbi:hypothetical protein [Demequina sp. NBRC 110052]|uniref:hypothetical protein n=1 Tax=Demequina sp. NBRC 110052 TaxID=1570341 RepID=UPI000A013F9B|nr:hypothetical protein [Demequina sp. NBRC 110052]
MNLRNSVLGAGVCLAIGALGLSGCSQASTTADATGPAGETVDEENLITLDAITITPSPLEEDGLDLGACEEIAVLLEDMTDLGNLADPERIYAAAFALSQDDLGPAKEAATEMNTLGADVVASIDAVQPEIANDTVVAALEGVREYYDVVVSPISQIWLGASSKEQLESDSTSYMVSIPESTLSAWYLDAAVIEAYAESTCAVAVDVFTEAGIDPEP